MEKREDAAEQFPNPSCLEHTQPRYQDAQGPSLTAPPLKPPVPSHVTFCPLTHITFLLVSLNTA